MRKVFIILAVMIFFTGCAAIVVPVPAAKVKLYHPGIRTEIILPLLPIFLPSVYIHGGWKHRHHHRRCH